MCQVYAQMHSIIRLIYQGRADMLSGRTDVLIITCESADY